MNNNKFSPTKGGVMTITLPGRGVSLQREGKSGKKAGRRIGKVKLPDQHKPTVLRAGFDRTRDIEMVQTQAHQIIHISDDVAYHWATEPMSDELVRTATGKKFLQKYKTEERFQIRLQEHFEAICLGHNLSASNCSWRFDPDD